MAAGPVQGYVREVARQGQAIRGARFFCIFLCAAKERCSGASPRQIEDASLQSRTKQATIIHEYVDFIQQNQQQSSGEGASVHSISLANSVEFLSLSRRSVFADALLHRSRHVLCYHLFRAGALSARTAGRCRSRLRGPFADPGRKHSPAAGGTRRAGHGADRHRQDRRLRIAAAQPARSGAACAADPGVGSNPRARHPGRRGDADLRTAFARFPRPADLRRPGDGSAAAPAQAWRAGRGGHAGTRTGSSAPQ